jgi:hypothetical protein
LGLLEADLNPLPLVTALLGQAWRPAPRVALLLETCGLLGLLEADLNPLPLVTALLGHAWRPAPRVALLLATCGLWGLLEADLNPLPLVTALLGQAVAAGATVFGHAGPATMRHIGE